MPVGIYNQTKGARRIGDVLIAPGTAAVIVDDSWSKNAIVGEWLKDGQLVAVATEEVEKINNGMDVKKAKAASKAAEKEADEGKGSNPPPPSK